MSSLKRADNLRIVNAVKAMNNADMQMYGIINKTNEYKTTVKNAAQVLRKKLVEDALKNIPVEELKHDKDGIRISLLKNAGYNNLSQLAGVSPQQLASINGIGADNAAKIVEKTAQICSNAEQLIKLKIQPTDQNQYANAIVTSLAVLINTKLVFDRVQTLYNTWHSGIAQHISNAKNMQSGIRWLFSSKDKKQSMLKSLMYLESLSQQGLANEISTLNNSFTTEVQKCNTQSAWNAFQQNSAPFFAWLEQLTGGATQSASLDTLPQQLAAKINDFKLNTSLMNAVLRSYQTFGAKYILHQKHSLLGDEMGLGKTMQAIAAMAHLSAEGKSHFLVVCPVSVMINWTREIVKHSKLTATKIHGNNRQQEFADWQSNGGVAVTTYETISRLDFDALQLDMLVVDEAHYIKNPNTIRTKALVKFTSITEYILFMTGTPIENKVDEMIFLISLLNSEIAHTIEQIKSLSSAPEFREKIAQVYLRRVREDVLTELPEKLEKEEWCIMTSAEEQTYKQTLMEGSYMQIRQVSWNAPQISDSSKANRLLEICLDAEANGRKVLVFSFFLNTIEKIRQLLGSKCYGPINGSVSADQRQALVDEFTNAPAGSVLLSQITAGGVGLNIQSASVVIICEPQWKPSTENQAISRVYRMGQSNNVVVHRLLADDTVDEKITDILKGKTEIFENFADESAIDEASKSIDENKAMAAILKDEREKYGVTEQQ